MGKVNHEVELRRIVTRVEIALEDKDDPRAGVRAFENIVDILRSAGLIEKATEEDE